MHFNIRILITICISLGLISICIIFISPRKRFDEDKFVTNSQFLLYDNTQEISHNETFVSKLPFIQKCTLNTQMLITVLTRTTEFEERKLIRTTWGSQELRKNTTKLIFIIAKDKDSIINLHVKEEQNLYEDILLLNFIDHYKNLTLKTYGLLNYANFYCPNLKCLLKVDSDMIVNVGGFEKLCDSQPENENLILGHKEKSALVRRNIVNKFYVPYNVYPKTIYPDYANGPTYFLSGKNITSKLLDTLKSRTSFMRSENFRSLPEDIIFTGEVRELAFISIKHISGIEYNGEISYLCNNLTNYRKIPLAYAYLGNNQIFAWEKMKKKIKSVDESSQNSIFSQYFRFLCCYFL